MSHLASVPQGNSNLTFLGQYDHASGQLLPLAGHLDCFAGGNFLLGGQVLRDPRLTTFGLVSVVWSLTDSLGLTRSSDLLRAVIIYIKRLRHASVQRTSSGIRPNAQPPSPNL